MKRIVLVGLCATFGLSAAAGANAQPPNAVVDRNNDGIACVNDRSGGFGSVHSDNSNPASETGCPAAFVRITLNP